MPTLVAIHERNWSIVVPSVPIANVAVWAAPPFTAKLMVIFEPFASPVLPPLLVRRPVSSVVPVAAVPVALVWNLPVSRTAPVDAASEPLERSVSPAASWLTFTA